MPTPTPTPVYVADMGSQNKVDLSKLAKAGCIGVIHRATRSNEQDDPLYESRRKLALAAGLKWGAYAFNTGEAASVQFDRFQKAAKPDKDTSCWLDLEQNPNGGQMTLAMVLEYLDLGDRATGRRIGLYSGNVIKTLIVKATPSECDFLKAHPLWGCQYGKQWVNKDVNNNELPWKAPFLWQFTGDDVGPREPHTLDGLENGADLSLFDGTADELRAAWPLPVLAPAPLTV
jgi:lysozyme